MTTRQLHSLKALALIPLVAVLFSGCLYTQQRSDDLLDIFEADIGVTAESEFSWIPPTFGVLAEFGPIALGGITHTGLTAELDGRGLYAGSDHRARLAGIYIQGWQHTDDYENGWTNYFKDESRSGAWHARMHEMSYEKWLFWSGTAVPAKDLLHEDEEWTWEVMPLRRGWQYWESIAAEVGISDPFLTHLGLYVRLGVDPSEILDFLLGFLTVDLKRDDIEEARTASEAEV